VLHLNLSQAWHSKRCTKRQRKATGHCLQVDIGKHRHADRPTQLVVSKAARRGVASHSALPDSIQRCFYTCTAENAKEHQQL
jgi:hypothetical protein